MGLVPQLEAIREEIGTINAQAVSICEGLGEDELAWRPQPGKWSIAENLIHLRRTTETFLPAIDHTIDQARRRNLRAAGPFRIGLMGRIFVWYTAPPPAMRLPAPPVLKPLLDGPAREALPRFLESQPWMLERLEAANGLDLGRARVTSPLASFVKMNLLAFFCVFTSHERRHLWQASNVRRELENRK